MSDDSPSIEELEARIRTFQEGLGKAWDAIDNLEEQLEDEREERRRLEDENRELRAELDRLDERTDLLRLVESTDEMEGEQYAAALVQHLKREAERKRDRGEKALASVDREKAERALNFPDVERTTIYKYMQDAERLVGDEDVVWYDSKGYGDTYLKLNLENGELPEIRGRR